jgi:hypothetical protein
LTRYYVCARGERREGKVNVPTLQFSTGDWRERRKRRETHVTPIPSTRLLVLLAIAVTL